MTVSNNSHPGGQRDEVSVVRATSLVTWQEPRPLAYQIVELSDEDRSSGKTSLPSVDWIVRPSFADAPDIATPEELEAAPYRLAGPLEEDLAKVEHRQYHESRLRELIDQSRRIARTPRRRGATRERYWYQCLTLPFLAWRLLLGLAAGLGVATVWLLPLEGNQALPWHIRYLVPVAVVAYVCGLFQCVLRGALAGDPPRVIWPGRHFHVALRYTGIWVYCLLVGPAPLALAALFYWVHCGELEFVDWFILIEAGVLAIGYGLFAVVAVARSQRLYDANPLQIAKLARQLGYRAAVVVALASLLVFEHARLILMAVGVAHENPFAGWFLLTLYWLSALASLVFLLRLVGWWCYCHGKSG
jgi:hypothetical protein